MRYVPGLQDEKDDIKGHRDEKRKRLLFPSSLTHKMLALDIIVQNREAYVEESWKK